MDTSHNIRHEMDLLQPGMTSLLQQTPSLPELDATLTLSDWKQAIHDLKVPTTRGICGWYTQKLRDLPDQAVDDLFHLFSSQMSSMPAYLMRARAIPWENNGTKLS